MAAVTCPSDGVIKSAMVDIPAGVAQLEVTPSERRVRPMVSSAPYIVGVDTGGTFTDVALLMPSGEVVVGKAATTPSDLSVGVLNAVRNTADQLGITLFELLSDTRVFKHGTTVATNSLITRTGARVGLITTRGFEDTPSIMRAIGRIDGLSADRIKHVSDVTKPEPLVPRNRIRGVRERVDYRGTVVVPIRLDDVDQAVEELVESEGCQTIAVSLLHAWRNPVHEEAIRCRVTDVSRDTPIFWSFGSDLSRVAGEYARTNTAIANCFVGPTVDRYLGDLERKLRAEGFTGTFLVLQGNGGAVGIEASVPIGSLQSGPAAGLIASAFMATELGHSKVLTADMGGTSLDVSILSDGIWKYAEESIFERFRILQPIAEIESIGAGGGTIARVDELTSRLAVGPDSAGASPGPACYGEGGTKATVTDVDILLGYIDPDNFLGGRKRLDSAAAEQAVLDSVAQPLGLDVTLAAAGVFDIINNKMADLIRTQIVRSGYLPGEFALYAFGGAGPVHAVAFARELGIREIVVFPTSAVFSAFGAAIADIVHTRVATFEAQMPIPSGELNLALDEIERALTETMESEGLAESLVAVRRIMTMRYRRQTHGVEVEMPPGPVDERAIAALLAAFESKYAETYGSGAGFAQAGIELSSIRVDAIGVLVKPTIESSIGSGGVVPARGTRMAFFDGRFLTTNVHAYADVAPGMSFPGPAILETPMTTIVVPPGWSATADPGLNLVIRDQSGAEA